MDNEERFREYLFEGDWLNRSINWITEHLLPEKVFNQDQLNGWAKKHGWTDKEEENKILWSIYKTCFGCTLCKPGIIYGCEIQKHIDLSGICNQKEAIDIEDLQRQLDEAQFIIKHKDG